MLNLASSPCETRERERERELRFLDCDDGGSTLLRRFYEGGEKSLIS